MAVDFSVWDEPISDTIHVVAVRGEIDIFTAPEFKQLIAAAIDHGADGVIVDLAQATFIDSSSLGVLITAHRRLEQRGGRMAIAADRPEVLRTFSITGLDSVLKVVATRDDALAAVQADEGRVEVA